MDKDSGGGLDIAKNVCQVHGVDDAGEVVIRRQLRRRQVWKFIAKLQPCLVGIEACCTAHQWARELRQLGHEVRLMPARYVKHYVTRPTMRFAPIKTVEQQSVLMVRRTRDLLIRQRTMRF